MKRGLWVAGVVWIGGAGLFLACSSGDDASSAAPDAAVTSDGATDGSKADVAAGDSSPQDSSPGDACTASPCVTQVAGGFLFECAVSTDRTVRCWGSNIQGALGHDTDGAPDDPVPTPVVGLSNVVQVAAGFYHACALTGDNKVYCWGTTTNGQLGPNALDAGAISTTPIEVTGIPGTVADLHMGGYFSCARLTDGRVFCWGDSSFGNFGPSTEIDAGVWIASSPNPVELTALGHVDEMNAGDRFTCGRVGGTVSCMGDNDFAQLGRGDAGLPQDTPEPVTSLTTVSALYESEAYHSCVLQGTSVLCWGFNVSGQCGQSRDAGTTVGAPVAVPGLVDVGQVSQGGISTCAVVGGGTVKCWGSNQYGEMAQPPAAGDTFPAPVDISGVTGVRQVAAGHQTICATLTNGGVVCWGENDHGELGRGYVGASDSGVPTYAPAPVQF